MTSKLTDTVVLITGASSGIGAAIARQLALGNAAPADARGCRPPARDLDE
jgi:NAD(P)-dependent dehydrogenase (short-subunit alcohol dehydrogenase family)